MESFDQIIPWCHKFVYMREALGHKMIIRVWEKFLNIILIKLYLNICIYTYIHIYVHIYSHIYILIYWNTSGYIQVCMTHSLFRKSTGRATESTKQHHWELSKAELTSKNPAEAAAWPTAQFLANVKLSLLVGPPTCGAGAICKLLTAKTCPYLALGGKDVLNLKRVDVPG